jgi:hypothetical protein
VLGRPSKKESKKNWVNVGVALEVICYGMVYQFFATTCCASCKVRTPIPLGYVGFYTMYYWMILTAIL